MDGRKAHPLCLASPPGRDKNWTDNFFQIFFMGTSSVALSIKNIKNSSEQRNDVTNKFQNVRFKATVPPPR